MSDTLEKFGVTMESSHPKGSIGYEWDCADHWATFIGGEEGKKLHALVVKARADFHDIQRQAISDFIDMPEDQRELLLGLMDAVGPEGGAKA